MKLSMKRLSISPETVREWREIVTDYSMQGRPKSQAYFYIAAAYGTSYTTVRYHLEPLQREHWLQNKKERSKKLWRKKSQLRRYNRNYRRLTRRPERFLSQVFNDRQEASVGEIQNEVSELAEGVMFEPSTIRKILDKYVENNRGPPFIELAEEGVYRIRNQEPKLHR